MTGKEITPGELVLRCYGHRQHDGSWYGVCLDLNLAVQADSVESLRRKLRDVIADYIETVLDTKDTGSVPALLTRRAPLSDWLTYYFIGLALFVRRLPDSLTFKETLPFHLACNC